MTLLKSKVGVVLEKYTIYRRRFVIQYPYLIEREGSSLMVKCHSLEAAHQIAQQWDDHVADQVVKKLKG